MVPARNRECSHIRIIPGRCTDEAGKVRKSDSLDVAGTKYLPPLGTASASCIQCPLEASLLESNEKFLFNF